MLFVYIPYPPNKTPFGLADKVPGDQAELTVVSRPIDQRVWVLFTQELVWGHVCIQDWFLVCQTLCSIHDAGLDTPLSVG